MYIVSNDCAHSHHILLSLCCVTTCSLCHDQRCHAEPLAPDAQPGCHGEASLHQL